MRTRTPTERKTQRVILRFPLQATTDEQPVLILELGLGGAKFEHAEPLAIRSKRSLTIGRVSLQGEVRYSMLLPSSESVIYHSGIEFTDATANQLTAVYEILIAEAQQQVAEWEANLEGAGALSSAQTPKSAAFTGYIWLRLTDEGWKRVQTTDPNQPLDGVAVPSDATGEEIQLLCETYEQGDERTRELLRTMATLAILERIRP